MKTGYWGVLLVVTFFGCSRQKGEEPNAPGATKSPAVPKLPKIQKPPEPDILYADEILRIGKRITIILDAIETPQDAMDSIPSLRPLAREYRRLKNLFNNCYIGDHYGIYPKLSPSVRAAVRRKMMLIAKQNNDALFRYYAKGFPDQVDDIMAKEIPFGLPFPLDPQTRRWHQSLRKAREEARKRALAKDPNTP